MLYFGDICCLIHYHVMMKLELFLLHCYDNAPLLSTGCHVELYYYLLHPSDCIFLDICLFCLLFFPPSFLRSDITRLAQNVKVRQRCGCCFLFIASLSVDLIFLLEDNYVLQYRCSLAIVCQRLRLPQFYAPSENVPYALHLRRRYSNGQWNLFSAHDVFQQMVKCRI